MRHLLAYGASQSAARLAAYLNGVQPIVSQFDAFLLLVFPNAPCALNAASAPAEIREAGGMNLHDLLRGTSTCCVTISASPSSC